MLSPNRPTDYEMVMALLDRVLGQPFTSPEQKAENLRSIELTAKRMADGIERTLKYRSDAA